MDKLKWQSVRKLLTMLIGMVVWSSSQAIAPHRQPLSAIRQHEEGSFLSDWIRAKCGPNGRQIWRYHGALYDPLDGRKVATVLGLELASLLRRNETEDLPIYKDVLKHPNATWHAAVSVWSQNIFCYTVEEEINSDQTEGNVNGGDPRSENTFMTKILRDIRVRPYSPEKRIPLEQSVSAYEKVTTWIERQNGEVFVHSEWPAPTRRNKSTSSKSESLSSSTEGQRHQTISVWNAASSIRRLGKKSSESEMGFSIFAKRRSLRSPTYLPDLTKDEDVSISNTSQNQTEVKKGGMIISPKRSSWIQFGSGHMETKHKFGARETYSISFVPSSSPSIKKRGRLFSFQFPWRQAIESPSATEQLRPQLSYTRYGEGPPFFAPGRMCMLELKAEPIESFDNIPTVLQELVQNQIQGWGRRHWNPRIEQQQLQLLPEVGSNASPWSRYKGYALEAWEKARSITNVVSFIRKERSYW